MKRLLSTLVLMIFISGIAYWKIYEPTVTKEGSTINGSSFSVSDPDYGNLFESCNLKDRNSNNFQDKKIANLLDEEIYDFLKSENLKIAKVRSEIPELILNVIDRVSYLPDSTEREFINLTDVKTKQSKMYNKMLTFVVWKENRLVEVFMKGGIGAYSVITYYKGERLNKIVEYKEPIYFQDFDKLKEYFRDRCS